jgi:hypothetical protein
MWLTLVARSWIFLLWRWRRYVLPKRRFTHDLQGATSQKTTIFIMRLVLKNMAHTAETVSEKASTERASIASTPLIRIRNLFISNPGWDHSYSRWCLSYFSPVSRGKNSGMVHQLGSEWFLPNLCHFITDQLYYLMYLFVCQFVFFFVVALYSFSISGSWIWDFFSVWGRCCGDGLYRKLTLMRLGYHMLPT